MKIVTTRRHKFWDKPIVRRPRYPDMTGKLPSSELNINGREKRGICSFQCTESLWKEYRQIIHEKYGKYKQSKHLESMIRKFVESERKGKEQESND